LESPPNAGIVSRVLATDAGRDEVESMLRRAKAAVRQMLDTRRDVVEALRDALLERDELIGEEIAAVIAACQADAAGTLPGR
jgi:cell division protease FtsH